MPYLDQTGLSTFWTKIKTWASTNFGATISKGTSASSGLPIYLKDKASTPNTISTVTITKSDITALGIPGSNTTYTPATQSANGLMSAADKKKLDGVAEGANKYVHPTSAAGAKTSGMYKVSTDAQGHVTGATAVTKDDITALGIPGSDTIYTHPAGNAPDKAEGLYKFSTDSKSHVASVTTVTKEDISPLESDPTVPAWAKKDTKPDYKASEISIANGTRPGIGGTVANAIEAIDTDLTNFNSSLANFELTKADKNSPTFTGTPQAPTAPAGTNTTQIATTAFVQSEVAKASTGAAKYQGGMTPASYQSLTTYNQGWYWIVTEAGSIAGETCEVGDMVFCNTDNTDKPKKDFHFDVVQTNITSIPDATINALS